MGTVNSFPTCYAFLSWPPMPCPTTDQYPFCLSPGNLSCLEEKKRKQTHVQSAIARHIHRIVTSATEIQLFHVESHSRFSNRKWGGLNLHRLIHFSVPLGIEPLVDFGKKSLNLMKEWIPFLEKESQIEMRAQNHPHFRHQDPPSSLTPLENATIFVVAFCPFPHPSGAISNAGRTEVKWVQSFSRSSTTVQKKENRVVYSSIGSSQNEVVIPSQKSSPFHMKSHISLFLSRTDQTRDPVFAKRTSAASHLWFSPNWSRWMRGWLSGVWGKDLDAN